MAETVNQFTAAQLREMAINLRGDVMNASKHSGASVVARQLESSNMLRFAADCVERQEQALKQLTATVNGQWVMICTAAAVRDGMKSALNLIEPILRGAR